MPEITVTPKGNYIYNSYDNIKLHLPKHANGKLPGYEDSTIVAPLTKSPQEILKGVPHEQGLSGADPIGKAFVAYMGGRAVTGAMAAWNRLRALKQGK